MKSPCPFEGYLEIEEVARKDGTATLLMPFRRELTNPVGFVHGGAIASLADSALAVALVSLLGHGEFFTARMEVRFKSPTRDKTLVCESKVESERANFYFGTATVKEEEGKVVADARASFFVAAKQSERPGAMGPATAPD